MRERERERERKRKAQAFREREKKRKRRFMGGDWRERESGSGEKVPQNNVLKRLESSKDS